MGENRMMSLTALVKARNEAKADPKLMVALCRDAIARKDAADLVLADPTARNAKKNAATQARVDALQDRDRARADKQLAGVVLFVSTFAVMLFGPRTRPGSSTEQRWRGRTIRYDSPSLGSRLRRWWSSRARRR